MKAVRSAALLAGVACCTAGSIAFASDFGSAEPSMYWRMEFDGPAKASGLRYGMALRQTEVHVQDVALPPLATVDFAEHGALATLAGLPVWQRHYRVSQTEDAPAPEGGEATEGGWLSDLGDAFAGLGVGTGTMIVAGGVAVAIMLLSTDADDGYHPGGNDGPGGNPPPADECLVPNPAPVGGLDCAFDPLMGTTAEPDYARSAGTDWLDAGTGQMGDLIAR